MISIKNITKAYEDKVVLDGFSAEFPGKGFVCIMGASGSGKTTLLNIIAGLEKPDSGTVRVDGTISMVFQEDRLLEGESAVSNVQIALKRTDTEARLKAIEILKELGLGSDLDTPVKDMSGGMKRRVAIARSLATCADIYIMDEPIKGLDKERARDTLSIIRRHTEDKLSIMVTHDISEAENATIIEIKK